MSRGLKIALGIVVLAAAIYVFVALIWLVPDRRIERVLGGDSGVSH